MTDDQAAQLAAAQLAARVHGRLGPDPAGIVEHVAAGGSVRPPVPAGEGPRLTPGYHAGAPCSYDGCGKPTAYLPVGGGMQWRHVDPDDETSTHVGYPMARDDPDDGSSTPAYRSSTGDLPAGERGDGYMQLHVRAYAAGARTVVEQLAAITPPPGPFGLINAATALGVAIEAIEAATKQATPHADAGQPVRPAELAALFGQVGEVFGELAYLVGQVSQQLVRLHGDAMAGRVAGPPSSTAHTEVERLIKAMLGVDRAVADAIEHADAARSRVGRLAPPG